MPARGDIPRIPHIPRPGTPATARWGMRGKGEKISPLTRWSRPILREPRLAGGAAMSAAQALSAARAVGIHLEVDGDDLLLEASAPPSSAILEELSQHKAEIVAVLRPGRDGWPAEGWPSLVREGAALTGFDGGLSRTEAEAQALACCIVEWLNRNPTPSAPGRCAWCGQAESRDAIVLPYGTEPGTHIWLHAECWPAWQKVRRSQATEALMRMGVGKHRGLT